jgi:protein SCO1/2
MSRSKKLWIFTATVLVLPVLLFFAVEAYEARYAKLPVYGPVTTVDGETVQHHITGFTMLDQDGYKVSENIIEDKVAVVNFFFTSCPSICPKMMRNVQTVQDMYRNKPELHIVSFTVDPKRDTPARLKKFADAYHVDKDNWHLLTGEKKEIYQLARNSFYLSASQGDGGDHDFIHSENLVLIDRQGRIRGYYDGTDADAVDELITHISKLKNDRS